MSDNISALLRQLAAGPSQLRARFAQPALLPPPMAQTVSFPRLEIVIDGAVNEPCLPPGDDILTGGDVLFIPAGKWNAPQWNLPVTTLSVLFSKQRLGFSLQHWDGKQLRAVDKAHAPRLGPRVGSYLLMALNEIALSADPATARLVIAGLLSHCVAQLALPDNQVSRSRELLMTIQEYIDEKATGPLTREEVARRFHITPNYLSHLFQKSGAIGFNDYLTAVRLEKAKTLLRGYDLKIKEIAHRCGFEDSNYFCRIFKKHTARSPSDYRRHCKTPQAAPAADGPGAAGHHQ